MNLNLIRFSPRLRIQHLLTFLVLVLFSVGAQPAAAQESVPPKQQAALFVEFLAFYTDQSAYFLRDLRPKAVEEIK